MALTEKYLNRFPALFEFKNMNKRKGFEKNYCRLCKKVFCCEKCRFKHESSLHKINPDCDICVYGQTYLKNAPEELLEHIKQEHWPLHCVRCQRVFKKVEEIFIHCKCQANNNDTPEKGNENEISAVTPLHSDDQLAKSVDNKPLKACNIGSYMTTSTPVFTGNDKDFVQIISGVITPVENLEETESSQNPYKAIQTPLLLRASKKVEQSSKRKVTFSENLLLTDDSNPKSSHFSPECVQKFTVEEQQSEFYTAEDKKLNILSKQVEEIKSDRVLHDETEDLENTLWQSAITDLETSKSENMELVIDPSEIVTSNCIGHIENHQPKQIAYIESRKEKCTTITYVFHAVSDSSCSSSSAKSSGLWSYVTSTFKNVVQGLSLAGVPQGRVVSQKRPKSDTEDSCDSCRDTPLIKKMKLTEIKCRRPIRNIRPFLSLKYRKKPRLANKLTQTDF